ncbi:MAG: Gfo/Idh/MocA family oxidoreductase [Clostridia bacterium]|nr:Gfo/Idh/MocA family oxidoreductase [Clostridia bacterium]
MIRTAMIGFGGIAQTHKNAHLKFEREGREKLVAVCDVTPSQFEKRIKINIETGEPELGGNFKVYYDREKMFRENEIDLVDICIPSYLHADAAVDALSRGYDVLSEKPMALCSADCERILEAMKKSGKRLMIGQCLRFYGEYVYLKEAVSDGRFGKVTGVLFQRLSALPKWSWQNWYQDFSKSGSVICDMQIHDLDMARYLFGEPEYIECRASTKNVKYDLSHISLGYPFPCTCIGDWTLNGTRFEHRYTVGFEKATLIMADGKVTVYPNDGSAPYEAEYRHVSGIEGEIDYYLDLLESGKENTKNPPESAAATVRLVEAAWRSADLGGERIAYAQ